MNIPGIPMPEDLKRRLWNTIVETIARQAEKMPGGDKMARTIRQLSSQAMFYSAFDQAVVNALKRFRVEYMTQDEDLVEAILTDGNFWQSKDLRQALIEIISRPGASLENERETIVQHFANVLPKRVNHERVDKAVTFFLRCVAEELLTLPGASQIREIYSLQLGKISTEDTRKQVALLEDQLHALVQISTKLEERLLTAPPLQPILQSTRPHHNLPQPDYTTFVGRKKELDSLCKYLSPHDRVWLMVITGIGGVGKSSLALVIADDYR